MIKDKVMFSGTLGPLYMLALVCLLTSFTSNYLSAPALQGELYRVVLSFIGQDQTWLLPKEESLNTEMAK